MRVRSRSAAYITIALAYLFGGGSLLLFALFLFHGSLNLIDLGLSQTAAIGLDAILSLAFFVQHSGLVRRSFRKRLQALVPKQYDIAFYAISSGVVLLALVVFWQETSPPLLSLQGILRWLLRAVYFLTVIGFLSGLRVLSGYDPLGVKPIVEHLQGIVPPSSPFVICGPYRWVRHPLYFLCLLMIWSCPDISIDRLLFNILWTLWMVIGTVLEERDLVADFGQAYRDYQRKVPMLIPWRFRPPR